MGICLFSPFYFAWERMRGGKQRGGKGKGKEGEKIWVLSKQEK